MEVNYCNGEPPRVASPHKPTAADAIYSLRASKGARGSPLHIGIQTNCGHYFRDPSRLGEDYNKIARAVEFFGGRLVIDWQDE